MKNMFALARWRKGRSITPLEISCSVKLNAHFLGAVENGEWHDDPRAGGMSLIKLDLNFELLWKPKVVVIQ